MFKMKKKKKKKGKKRMKLKKKERKKVEKYMVCAGGVLHTSMEQSSVYMLN